MSRQRVYTEGSVSRSLFILALPIVLTNVLQTAYHVTDTFWLGRLGAGAVAAVSISFPVLFMILSAAAGLAVAGTILVSQYAGRREQASVDHVAAQTLLLLLIVGAALSLVGFFFSPALMRLFPIEDSVHADALVYLRVVFAGAIFLFFYFAFQSLLRGVGIVRLPMYITAGTVILNLFLDPLFIFGYGFIPPLGVAGAAVATLATQGLAAILAFALLASGRYGIRIRRSDVRPDPRLMKQVIRLGLPVSAEHLTVSLGMFMMVSLVTVFGTEAVAAYGLGMRVFSLAIIPAFGFSMGVSTLVGQNMGALKVERADRVGRTGRAIAFWSLTLIGVVLFLAARLISAIFVPGDEAVIDLGARFTRIMALTFGFVGYKTVIGGVYTGSGNTRTAMFLTFVYLWGMRVPFAWFASRFTALGLSGIWWSFPAANLLGACLAGLLFRHGTWKMKRLVGVSAPGAGHGAPRMRKQ